MGGLALIARAAGHRVTGCDAGVYPPMSTQLEAHGIELCEGYAAEQIGLGADLYVVGNVVKRRNPLMEAILEAGLPYVSGPQWLGENVLNTQHVLAVAGTHGKTTTTAMLAHILTQAGRDPSFLVGGVALDLGVSARLAPPPAEGRGLFVIEADEYDTAFFDKRSKFVHYRPRTAVLNNLEFDHADIFHDLAAIENQFHHLVRTIPTTGRVIVPAADEALARVLERGCWSEVVTTGPGGTWTTGTPAADGSFTILRDGQELGTITWAHQGAHNRANALAALVAAEHVGVAPEASIAALSAFVGVRRRMELRGTVRGISVYDDFAHHPTAIATTLAGLRESVGDARIVAVLEPRSNTMKLGVMKARLVESLVGADAVYGYGAPEGRNALGWDLAETLDPLGEKARAFTQIDTLVAAIAIDARPGDHIVVMSNGSFDGIHERLLEVLDAAGPHA